MTAESVDRQGRIAGAELALSWVRPRVAREGQQLDAHGEALATLAALDRSRVPHVHREFREVTWQVKVVHSVRGLLGVAARRGEQGAWLDVPCWPAELFAAIGARRTGSPYFVEVEANLVMRRFTGRRVFVANVRAPRDRRSRAVAEVGFGDGGRA